MDLLIVSCGLALSIALNAYQFIKSNKKISRTNSVELQEFIADMMMGKAGVFAVKRLDEDNLIYRNPVGRQ